MAVDRTAHAFAVPVRDGNERVETEVFPAQRRFSGPTGHRSRWPSGCRCSSTWLRGRWVNVPNTPRQRPQLEPDSSRCSTAVVAATGTGTELSTQDAATPGGVHA